MVAFLLAQIGKIKAAISGLTSGLEWQLLDSKTGSTDIPLSGITFRELYIVFDPGYDNYFRSMLIVKECLANSAKSFTVGDYQSDSVNSSYTVQVSKTNVKLAYAYDGGNNILSTTVTKVYYR